MSARTWAIYLVLAVIGIGVAAVLLRSSEGERHRGANVTAASGDEDDAGGKRRAFKPRDVTAGVSAGRMVRGVPVGGVEPAEPADVTFDRLAEERSGAIQGRLEGLGKAIDATEDDTTSKDLLLTFERKALATVAQVNDGSLSEADGRKALDALEKEVVQGVWDAYGTAENADALEKFIGRP